MVKSAHEVDFAVRCREVMDHSDASAFFMSAADKHLCGSASAAGGLMCPFGVVTTVVKLVVCVGVGHAMSVAFEFTVNSRCMYSSETLAAGSLVDVDGMPLNEVCV